MKRMFAAWIYTQDQNKLDYAYEYAKERNMAVLGDSHKDVPNLLHTLSSYELNVLLIDRYTLLSGPDHRLMLSFCNRKGISIVLF